MAAEPSEQILHFPIIIPRRWVTPPPQNTATNTSTSSSSCGGEDLPFVHFYNILSLVTVLVSACGAAGNGAVIWLLGFRGKRTPFSVYVLHLACADAAFLLSRSVLLTLLLLRLHGHVLCWLVDPLALSSYLAGLGLLVAIGAERCVSVLWPLWHRCRRPARLSSVVCGLIWALSLCGVITWLLCVHFVGLPRHSLHFIYYVAVATTFLLLCASGLTLLLRARCISLRRPPTRLYVTVLLKVLAFLLLALPYTVAATVYVLAPALPYRGTLLPILRILSVLNSLVNPIIYFFVGRHGQRPGRAPLREVLQRALRDEEEGPGHRGSPVSTETTTST
ncbi:mas-related G-protein coupled receptor member X1-like [Talpa occidentalis]|uniref:mas-related G-protein coupled receptor member X1-like n=1 Tax=Talpa occidentalis TaxID=50954 RepID=UPI00188EF11B|nr:mas-related G-protein coupled receptor member X1-like [Talpa occidentalis]